MWQWINAFLGHREERCIVNLHTGHWFQTFIGLAHGSETSPILFNIFILAIFEGVSADRCKFADDATIWHTSNDYSESERILQGDLDKIQRTTSKWRMKISTRKTEYTLYSKQKEKDKLKLKMGGENTMQT